MPILLALLIVPVLELYVIVQVGDRIGLAPTIILLIAVSLAGTWLLKREGTATWRRLRETLGRGQVPSSEVTDGALILFAGALLLTPGFLTDVFGLLLLLPPTRATIKKSARRFLGGRAAARFGMSGMVGQQVYEAKARRTRTTERPTTGPAETPVPSSLHRGDEDGSPDTG